MWKWIGFFIALVIAAFFALGIVRPAIEVTNSTVINRSPEVVWRVFTDAPRTRQWLTGLQSMEGISGAPLSVGRRDRLVFLEGGRRVEMEEIVTAIEPGRRYAFDSSMGEMKGSTDIRLTPKDGGTELAFTSVYAGQSMLWRSMLVIMRPTMVEREAEDMAKLKALVEAEPH